MAGFTGGIKVACEGLESRVLLAGSSFPPPVLLGTFDGGWDSISAKSIGSNPSYAGKLLGPGGHPRYTLDGGAFTGSIPLTSISWGEGVSGMTVSLGDVLVSAPVGRYSTGLVQAAASKRNLDTLNLHVYDDLGRETRRWTLGDATITSLALGDAAGDQTAPVNSFSLHFHSITAATIAYDMSGNAMAPRSVSYDLDSGDFTSVDFGKATFGPGAQPQQLLDLGTGQVAVHSVSWGETAPGVERGEPLPPPTQDFAFVSDTGPASLGLISAVFTGARTNAVTLVTRDDAGRIVARWNLSGVVVTSYQSGESQGATPIDNFSLHADRVQFVRYAYNSSGALTSTYGAGFDYVNNLVDSSVPPSTLAGNSYPATAQPSIALQIDDSAQLIPIESMFFGDHQSGPPLSGALESFTLAFPQGAYSTGLLAETSRPTSHAKMAIITRNAAGQEVMRWVLTGAELASYATSDYSGDGQGPLDVVTLSFLTLHAQYTPYNKGAPQPPVVADLDVEHNSVSSSPLAGDTYLPGTEPKLALDLGGTLIPVYSAGEAYQRAADRPAGQTAPKPPPTFAPFGLSIPQGRWSPSLLAAVAAGTAYPSASLISRDSSGRVTGRWNLGGVQFSSWLTSSASASAATYESLNVTFASIEHTIEEYNAADGTTKVYAGGWDINNVQPTPDGSSLGATFAGNTYGAGAVPEYTLAIADIAGLIPVASFSWGDATGDPTAGPAFDQVALLLPAGRYDTGILPAIASGKTLDPIVLVRRDAAGRPIYRYTFKSARFSSFSTQDSPGQVVLNSVVVDFKSYQVERIDYSSAGNPLPAVQVNWDIGPKSGTGTSLGGQVFAPGTEPESLLDIGGTQLDVSAYSWAESRDPDAAHPTLGDFTFSTPTGQASLGLLSSVALATVYPQVFLTTRDADGHVVTQWKLTDVTLGTWHISAAAGSGVPQESVAMRFSSIKLVYNAYAPAAVVEAVTPAPRNTAVPSLVIRFSEPVTGLDFADLQLTRDGGANLLTAQQTLVSSDGGRTWTLGNLSAITGAADGTYSLAISTAPAAGILGQFTAEPIAQATGAQWRLDRVAPTLAAKFFDYAVSPNRIRITFSEDVGTSLTKDDLVIEALKSGAPPLPAVTGFAYDPATRVATWTFASNLPDGNYRATLAAGSVTDLATNALARSTLDFFALTGDANHDRSVDFLDLAALAQNYNTTGGRTFAQGDFNYDGNVDFLDLALLAQGYNTTLAAPGGAAAPLPVASVLLAADWAAVQAGKAISLAPQVLSQEKTKLNHVFNVQSPVKHPPKPVSKQKHSRH